MSTSYTQAAPIVGRRASAPSICCGVDPPHRACCAGSNCAACHAGGRNVIIAEKTLQQEALEQYLDGGANEVAVRRQVTNGKNAMPAFGGRLSEENVRFDDDHNACVRHVESG